MLAIKILKQEIEYLQNNIKALTKMGYTSDSYATLEITGKKEMIKELENSIEMLKKSHLVSNRDERIGK